MCEPISATTAAYIALGTTVAAGGYTAYTQRQQGKYNRKLADQNAEIQAEAAQDAVRRGKNEADKRRIQTAHIIGSQRAAQGASGVQINSGSPLDVQVGTAAVGEEEAILIESNAAREAYGFRVSGFNAKAQGKLDQAKANADSNGTILTTGAQAFNLYSQAPRKPAAKGSAPKI